MKAFALSVLIATLLALIMLTANILNITVQSPDGMMNPVFQFQLQTGTRDELLTCLLASVIAAYFYAVVAWMDGKLARLREELVADAPVIHLAQPLEVRQLKDAIRTGDLAAIRRYATDTALAYSDERFMTPFELAELYGRQDAVQALHRAASKKPGAHFAIRARRA
ncbi:hypothetical protein EWI61_12835 [Methylolobus aquaticus]|nr:hypothetical protein EWI61_12835 [Methylolobus aquaticus]